ncbi:MAG: hypothetical protein WC906_03345 [Parcubacteria group bacterium]|jgi:hypothetical protein
MILDKEKRIAGIKKISSRSIAGFFGQEFWKSSLIHWLLIGTLFLDAVSWGLLIFYIRPIDLPMVLHYNVYLGVDIIGDWWQVYFLPIISNLFLLVNTILAYLFYQKKERLAAYIFLLASFFVEAGILIAIAGLLMINY